MFTSGIVYRIIIVSIKGDDLKSMNIRLVSNNIFQVQHKIEISTTFNLDICSIIIFTDATYYHQILMFYFANQVEVKVNHFILIKCTFSINEMSNTFNLVDICSIIVFIDSINYHQVLMFYIAKHVEINIVMVQFPSMKLATLSAQISVRSLYLLILQTTIQS